MKKSRMQSDESQEAIIPMKKKVNND